MSRVITESSGVLSGGEGNGNSFHRERTVSSSSGEIESSAAFSSRQYSYPPESRSIAASVSAARTSRTATSKSMCSRPGWGALDDGVEEYMWRPRLRVSARSARLRWMKPRKTACTIDTSRQRWRARSVAVWRAGRPSDAPGPERAASLF